MPTSIAGEAKRRFEIMAPQVFIRFKALLMEPNALAYAERHHNIEAIYKKLQDRRDTADVSAVLKELHRMVNEAIRAAAPDIFADFGPTRRSAAVPVRLAGRKVRMGRSGNDRYPVPGR